MRKLTANMFLTVDGVMQAPGGPDEDRSGGFSHGGWIAKYWDDRMQEILGAWMSRPFDLVLGRKTYEIFAAHWPRITNDPTATGLNNATKYVASRTLKQLDWQPAQLLGPDVPKAVAELKRGDGRELQLHGSGDLLQTLFRHKLVDEIRISDVPDRARNRQAPLPQWHGTRRTRARRVGGVHDRCSDRELQDGWCDPPWDRRRSNRTSRSSTGARRSPENTGLTQTDAEHRRMVAWRRVAVALAVWSLAYAGYRAYYAAGGQFGMIGEPRSPAQFRAINAVGAAIIVVAGMVPLAALRLRAVRRALPVLGWIAAVGCCMHALVNMTLRVLSVTGVHPTQLPPEVWLSFDRHTADLQDLLLNEPWFFIEGLLWAALAVALIHPARRRVWMASAAAACLMLAVVGVLSGLGVIRSFRWG